MGEILGLAFTVLQTGSYFYLPRSISDTRRAISECRGATEGPEFDARVNLEHATLEGNLHLRIDVSSKSVGGEGGRIRVGYLAGQVFRAGGRE